MLSLQWEGGRGSARDPYRITPGKDSHIWHFLHLSEYECKSTTSAKNSKSMPMCTAQKSWAIKGPLVWWTFEGNPLGDNMRQNDGSGVGPKTHIWYFLHSLSCRHNHHLYLHSLSHLTNFELSAEKIPLFTHLSSQWEMGIVTTVTNSTFFWYF